LVKQRKQLHDVTGLSKEEASSQLLKLLEDELSDEVGGRILRHEKQVQETCEEKSREILLMTMQRYASAQTSEHTTSTVDIPSDELKGRIIGREGRNIRAFEKETGIDVIIDDTPGVVIVSGVEDRRSRSRERSGDREGDSPQGNRGGRGSWSLWFEETSD
jgi:ribonuclease Y